MKLNIESADAAVVVDATEIDAPEEGIDATGQAEELVRELLDRKYKGPETVDYWVHAEWNHSSRDSSC